MRNCPKWCRGCRTSCDCCAAISLCARTWCRGSWGMAAPGSWGMAALAPAWPADRSEHRIARTNPYPISIQSAWAGSRARHTVACVTLGVWGWHWAEGRTGEQCPQTMSKMPYTIVTAQSRLKQVEVAAPACRACICANIVSDGSGDISAAPGCGCCSGCGTWYAGWYPAVAAYLAAWIGRCIGLQAPVITRTAWAYLTPR